MQTVQLMTFCLYHGATEISIQYKISLQRLLGLNPTVSEIIVVHSLSCVQLFETLWTAARQASLSFTICWNSLKLMSIELVMPSNHLILCHSLLLLPPIFPSIRVFSSELAVCIRWPKKWSLSFSISSSNEYSGLISFRINQLDFLAGQGAVKNFLQHHSLKASVLQCSAFLMVQLSHLYRTTRKTRALTRWTFVSKVMSLLFNILSQVSHSFYSKKQVSFNFTSAVTIRSDFGAQENKVCHCFHFFPMYLP